MGFKTSYGVNIILSFMNIIGLLVFSFILLPSPDTKTSDMLAVLTIFFVIILIVLLAIKVFLKWEYEESFSEFNQPILLLLIHFGLSYFFVWLHLPYLFLIYALGNVIFNVYHLNIYLKIGHHLETTYSNHYHLLQEQTIIQQTKWLRTVMKQDVYAKYQVSKKLINETKLTKQDREELLENLDKQFRSDLIVEVKKVVTVDPKVVMKKELRSKTIQESKEARLRLEKTFREVHEKLD